MIETLLLLLAIFLATSTAFVLHLQPTTVAAAVHLSSFSGAGSSTMGCCSTSTSTFTTRDEVVAAIDTALTTQLGSNPEMLLQQLEKWNEVAEPNRSPLHFGVWHVWYTDCPPPSNGRLGPLQGSAQQVIPTEGIGYQNILTVGDNFLTATLQGVWEEWNGEFLAKSAVVSNHHEEATSSSSTSSLSFSSHDWGAAHWKVTFQTLEFALFGFPVFTKQFPAGTSRIWRTTYLDDTIRVVRAGKTGLKEDEVVFYTKRIPPANGLVASPR